VQQCCTLHLRATKAHVRFASRTSTCLTWPADVSLMLFDDMLEHKARELTTARRCAGFSSANAPGSTSRRTSSAGPRPSGAASHAATDSSDAVPAGDSSDSTVPGGTCARKRQQLSTVHKATCACASWRQLRRHRSRTFHEGGSASAHTINTRFRTKSTRQQCSKKALRVCARPREQISARLPH